MNDVEHPDFVVNLGDVVEDETRERDIDHYRQFTEILSGLDVGVFHVAGNHDSICMTDDDVRALWSGHQGPLYYSRDFSGLHLVFLRTHEIKDTAIRMPPEQIDWVEADLAATELPALVFMHHPCSEMRLETSRWFANQPHICRLAERKKLRQVFEKSGRVLGVFNGHVHWNHFDLIGSIPYFTLQSLTENLDDDAPGRPAASWAVCDIDEHRLHVRIAGAAPALYQVEYA
jgi:3',5'-cyclic AMP phosphodiesterase CpdA